MDRWVSRRDPEAAQLLARRELRLVLLFWLLLLSLTIGMGLLACWRWRRLTPREAGVYLCSVTWRWSAREQEALEKYTWRKRRR